MRKSKKRLAGVSVATLALLIAFSGVANAQRTARTSTEVEAQPFQLPPESLGGGVAQFNTNCDRGFTVASGGGLLNPSAPPATTNIALSASGPQGDGWLVRYQNQQSVFALATVEALCLKNKLKLKGRGFGNPAKKPRALTRFENESQQVILPANSVTQSNVACPRGSRVVGGGAEFPSATPLGTNVRLYESAPSGNRWHARWRNATGLSQIAALTALCLENRLPVKGGPTGGNAKARTVIERETQSFQLPPNTISSGEAEFDIACDDNTDPVGGGAVTPSGARVFLLESGPTAGGWHVRLHNQANAFRAVTVYANCLQERMRIK
jgi:hypothetical protein